MTSRDDIALAMLPEMHRAFQDAVGERECECPPDWRRQVARDAYRMADAFIIERAHHSD